MLIARQETEESFLSRPRVVYVHYTHTHTFRYVYVSALHPRESTLNYLVQLIFAADDATAAVYSYSARLLPSLPLTSLFALQSSRASERACVVPIYVYVDAPYEEKHNSGRYEH